MLLVIDAMCWGAASVADAGNCRGCFCPFTHSCGRAACRPSAPAAAMAGLCGPGRDNALRPLITGTLDRLIRPPLNRVRADVGAPQVTTFDEFLRRAPLMLVAGGEPFEYPHPDWGDSVQMIGACASTRHRLPRRIGSSHRGPDRSGHDVIRAPGRRRLATITMLALADQPVHVVATLPGQLPSIEGAA